MENVRGVLRDARQRVSDSHKLQMRNVGMDAGGQDDSEMGDLIATGDIITTQQIQRSIAPLWLTGLVCALLAGAGVWALMRDDGPAEPQDGVDTNTRYEYGVESRPRGET